MLQRVNDTIQGGMCAILNFFWRYTKKIAPSLRGRLLTISFMMISICAYCYMILPISVHLLWKCVIGAFVMFLILLFSIDREIYPVKWNKGVVFFWLMFGFLRFLSGFTASIEFLPLACIWLIGFPFIFLVWNNRRDYLVLFSHLYTGFLYPTIAFFVLSISFVPIGENAYTGIIGNTNAVGLHISAIFPLAFAYFLLKKNARKRERIINVICIWLSIAFAFYSRGRTVMLVITGVIIIGFLAEIIFLEGRFQNLMKKAVVLIIGSIVTIVICIPVNGFLTSILPNYIYENSVEEETASVNDAVSGFLDRVEGKDKAAPGLNNYSSGRIGIWIEAINNLNFKGNPSRNHIVTDRNGDVGNNAHNVFIQFAYDNGIVAGVCFLLLIIFSTITTIRGCFFSKRNKRLYILLLLITVAYLCEGVVTSINLPFLYVISFVYYSSFAVLFDEELKEELKIREA